jgi:hypothetical protein
MIDLEDKAPKQPQSPFVQLVVGAVEGIVAFILLCGLGGLALMALKFVVAQARGL